MQVREKERDRLKWFDPVMCSSAQGYSFQGSAHPISYFFAPVMCERHAYTHSESARAWKESTGEQLGRETTLDTLPSLSRSISSKSARHSVSSALPRELLQASSHS
jgi:hypothetical protein